MSGQVEVVEGTSFARHHAPDRLGRDVVFYLSTAEQGTVLPVAVFVQGSGCDSQFHRRNGRTHGGLHNVLRQAGGSRVRVLVVEKPGVAFLDESKDPGSAEGCPDEFLREHTLPRWSEAVTAAVRAALVLPTVNPSRCLVVGHSEGGIVAAKVAANEPKVTHVASLAGGGPTQLFDFLAMAKTATERAEILAEWTHVLADPDSLTKFWMGHPYRRWSSFLASSTLENLLISKAHIYLAHGTADQAVPVASFDVLHAELLAHRRPVAAERMEGADHGFDPVGDDRPSVGLRDVMSRVVDWYLR